MKLETTLVRITAESVLQVKIAIPGTKYTLGEFYAIAAAEKIDRDNLRTWIETPVKLSMKQMIDSSNVDIQATDKLLGK